MRPAIPFNLQMQKQIMNTSFRSVLLLLVLLLGVSGSGCGYNYVIGLDEAVNQSFAEVDNELKRRNDLVPELVETVKGVAEQEQTVFLGIAEGARLTFKLSRPIRNWPPANRWTAPCHGCCCCKNNTRS